MKHLFTLILLFSVNAQAGDFFDGITATCHKGDLELKITGARWVLAGRTFTLSRSGQVLLDEGYTVQDYSYNYRLGFFSPEISPALHNLTTTVWKLKGRIFDSDFRAYTSDRANFYLFIDNLNPAYGGKSSAIIFQANNGSTAVFEVDKDCTSPDGSLRTW